MDDHQQDNLAFLFFSMGATALLGLVFLCMYMQYQEEQREQTLATARAPLLPNPEAANQRIQATQTAFIRQLLGRPFPGAENTAASAA